MKAKHPFLILLTIAFTFGGFSCRKEFPTLAKIRILDVDGNVFPGAMVRLHGIPTILNDRPMIMDDTLYADSEGYAIFNYTDMYNLGQAGFAVLDIEVRSGDSLYGEGIIKVEDEVTSEEQVIIQ